MTIVCVEGASAVGKTTVARELCEQTDAIQVPEVNALFDRPMNESETWYLDRQVDRWRLARESENESDLVVLDGDPLQPLWYNWIARHVSGREDAFAHEPSIERPITFYRERFRLDELGFPSRYYLLFVNDRELERRKNRDETRARRNFEYHRQFARPQKRYFGAMSEFEPGSVQFLKATDVESIVRAVRTDDPRSHRRADAMALFDELTDWLVRNEPR